MIVTILCSEPALIAPVGPPRCLIVNTNIVHAFRARRQKSAEVSDARNLFLLGLWRARAQPLSLRLGSGTTGMHRCCWLIICLFTASAALGQVAQKAKTAPDAGFLMEALGHPSPAIRLRAAQLLL